MPSPCLIMGVLNLTPDSFSDGGLYNDFLQSRSRILQLIENGADIIDIGAQSSRPGAKPICLNEEKRRLEPVLNFVSGLAESAKCSVKFSIDTDKAEVMLEAVDAGFSYINNINGLADKETLLKLVAARPSLQYIAMHKRGSFTTMQENPLTSDKHLRDIEEFFVSTKRTLLEVGFKNDSIWLDPGVGFGKTDSLNLKILQRASQWSQQFNMVYGVSRKSFMGRLLSIDNPIERDAPSKMLECSLILAGVKMIRTHDVKRLKYIREFVSR